MRYTPRLYAKALVGSLSEARSVREKDAITKRFIAFIARRGETGKLQSIMKETDVLVREEKGQRSVVLETARAVPRLKQTLKHIIKKTDAVEERINPDLIAGIRITINGERQLDGSMAGKLKKLFT